MIAVWIAIAALALVVGVPYFVIKHASVGVIRRAARDGDAVALTFDDGPDPEITPRVLDALAAHGATATFFVKGDAADAHPELVHRIVAAGHEVGSHSYTHRHALFHRPPLAGWFDTRRGVAKLEARLGRRVRWFRPPWGAYSWSVVAAIAASRVSPVHWSLESHDWHPRFAPGDVVARVVGRVRPGDIIVMHDAGRGGAKTVAAIDGVLRGLSERGLRSVGLSRLALRTGLGTRVRGEVGG